MFFLPDGPRIATNCPDLKEPDNDLRITEEPSKNKKKIFFYQFSDSKIM